MKRKQFKTVSVSTKVKISKRVNGTISVKAGLGLIDLFKKQIYIILNSFTSARVRSLYVFATYVYKLQKHQGRLGVVKTLKSASVCIMQSVGGSPLKDIGPLGPRFGRTNGGLPRFIPSVDRESIRRRNVSVIRLWLSLCSLYRIIDIEPVLKLNSITDPGSGRWHWDVIKFSSAFARGFNLELDLKEPSFFAISSASATQYFENKKASTSLRGIINGAIALTDSGLLPAVRLWASDAFYNRLLNFSKFREDVDRFPTDSLFIGALGFIKEPAGKMRVVAMVECWTQWLLRPLHDSIFKWLESNPCDGTMDQLKPVRRLIDKGHTKFWCYDLSSATDRLPIDFQVSILVPLIGKEKAEAWKELLVGRDYHYCPPSGPRDKITLSKVRYSVGQPMGALSSWAMLALSHHIIVANAASRVGFPVGTFTSYAVLGDDIVLANGLVARSYLQVMSELGVEIGLAKSLVSRKGVLEFAKRFFVDGVDCSPVSLREILSANLTIQGKIELAKKYNTSLPGLLTLSGCGFKTKGWLTKSPLEQSRRVRNLGLLYYSPWGVIPLEDHIWFQLRSFILTLETYLPDVPYSYAINQWRNSLVNKYMGYERKMNKYNFPNLSEYDWYGRISSPFLESKLLTERYLRKNSINNCLSMLFSQSFAESHSALNLIRAKIMSYDFNIMSLMEASKFGSVIKDMGAYLNFRKPSIRDKESLRIPDLWMKENTHIEFKVKQKVDDLSSE